MWEFETPNSFHQLRWNSGGRKGFAGVYRNITITDLISDEKRRHLNQSFNSATMIVTRAEDSSWDTRLTIPEDFSSTTTTVKISEDFDVIDFLNISYKTFSWISTS